MDQAAERMKKIILGTTDSGVVPNALQRVLFGLAPPSEPEDIGEIQYFNPTGLNDSQKKAVRLALSSPELALIHGPPGVRGIFLNPRATDSHTRMKQDGEDTYIS